MNNCVVTLATGIAEEWLKITKPFQESYAKKIKADYIIIDKPVNYPLGGKWRLSKMNDHERYIFLDADVIPRSHANNLFESVPVGSIGIEDDLPTMIEQKKTDWYNEEINAIQLEQKLKVEFISHCYNTGVVVWDKADRDLWNPPTERFKPLFCFEQHLFNLRLKAKGTPVYALDSGVHWQWWRDRPDKEQRYAHFVHASGLRDHAERLAFLSEVAAEERGKKKLTPPALPKKNCGCGPKTLKNKPNFTQPSTNR